MSCDDCCSGTDDCPRCGTCSTTWNEGFDEYGEAFGGWFGPATCSGATFTDSEGREYLFEGGARCTCVIANRQGNYVGEVISGLCVTNNQPYCKCCYATFENGAWVLDNGCDATDGAIFAHGGGFVVRTICQCPTPVGTADEGTTYLLGCESSYYCDWDEGIEPNGDCTDP
jgi:hypothetical protein